MNPVGSIPERIKSADHESAKCFGEKYMPSDTAYGWIQPKRGAKSGAGYSLNRWRRFLTGHDGLPVGNKSIVVPWRS